MQDIQVKVRTAVVEHDNVSSSGDEDKDEASVTSKDTDTDPRTLSPDQSTKDIIVDAMQYSVSITRIEAISIISNDTGPMSLGPESRPSIYATNLIKAYRNHLLALCSSLSASDISSCSSLSLSVNCNFRPMMIAKSKILKVPQEIIIRDNS